MVPVVQYHRPASLDEALALLARPGAVALAGGCGPDQRRSGPLEVVDLQDVGDARIEWSGPDHLRVGARATLQDLVEADVVPPVLRDLARRAKPSSLRTLATLASVIAERDPESELLAGLLVHDAVVAVAEPGGTVDRPLCAVLTHPAVLDAAVITHVTLHVGGRTAVSRTGRTPADTPIVAAVARKPHDRKVRLALSGVAPTPVLIEPHAVDQLDPPSDFRGSAEYRRHLAAVHAARVVADVQ